MKKIFLLVFFFSLAAFLASSLVTARSGEIAALAVVDENSTNGTVASISLEIRPGSGSVFIESFPLTRLDTQVSTRFGKEVACQLSSENCDAYDFFYIIRVGSGVIGGPSASGAITVLTYAVLEDLPLNNQTAMTGSIMSGGIIGPVGGIRGKVAAASANGFENVIIPAWDTNDSGIPLADRFNLDIHRVRTVEEAISIYTGRSIGSAPPSINSPIEYTTEMKLISEMLCAQADVSYDMFRNLDIGNKSEVDVNRTNRAIAQREKATISQTKKAYYTSASQCFGAATIFHALALERSDNETLENEKQILEEQHKKLSDSLNEVSFKTIADLEIALIVTERLADVQETLSTIDNETSPAIAIAYASQRLQTARAWMGLFGKIPSKELDLSEESLAASCRQKIEEAQERVHYLSYLYPTGLTSADDSLKKAFDDAHSHIYTLCLLHASQAIAEANSIITAIHVPQADFETVIAQKLHAARVQLKHQEERGVFPILGYSYAEYADQLIDDDKYSASLYAEYSLVFSELDIYFPPRRAPIVFDPDRLWIFLSGLCLGAIAGILAGYQIWRTSRKASQPASFSKYSQKPFGKEKTHRPKKVPITRNLPGKKR